jgi:predicted ATPase with chaperone activity
MCRDARGGQPVDGHLRDANREIRTLVAGIPGFGLAFQPLLERLTNIILSEFEVMITEDTEIESVAASSAAIMNELSKVIVGQEEIVKGLVASLFANGHCLLIGVPGLAKTLLVHSIARVLSSSAFSSPRT